MHNVGSTREAIWVPTVALLIGLVALGTLLITALLPTAALSTDALVFAAVAGCFSIAVCGTLGISQAASSSFDTSYFSVALIIWLFLMLSEGLFVHLGTTSSAAAGSFGAGAYQQVAAWVLSFVAFLLITSKYPGFIFKLFSGQFKWISLFALAALISVPISTSPLYSLAWTFKLILVVLLLRALASCLKRNEDVVRLFQTLLLGMLGVSISKFVTPFLEPGLAFRGGRLEMIAGMSGYAGLLLMLVLINLRFNKTPWLFVIAAFALVMMMLTGGKAGILGTIVALAIYFLVLKKIRHAVGAVLSLCLTLAIFVAFTPLGDYLQRYNQSGQVSTLSGRVDLWSVIWPAILAHPIVGHGYLASRFLSADVVGAFAEAGQTHNSLIEPLYNNGLLGLLPILAMNYIIVRNLIAAMKDHSDSTARYMAAGSFAIYVHLFVWGMFTATSFGGLPDCAFMTFLTIFIISGFLKMRSISHAI
jgi:O-antigen ligase